MKIFNNLCTPSQIYLIVSLVSVLIIMIQNINNTERYCIGLYECAVPNTLGVFIFKLIYIAFWTFVLNSICKAGHTDVSWFLLFLPFILLFVVLGYLLITQRGSMMM